MNRSRSSKSLSLFGAALASIILLSSCASISTTKSAALRSGATLLVMPPRDVVQGGRSHVVGEGSGRQLQRAVQSELTSLSNYNIILFESNDTINHSASVKKEDALTEAKKIGADYVLTLNLGEFRNAAPMTFRSDFVTLQSGFLFDVSNSAEIWSLDSPLLLEKSNFGNHYGLIDDIAKSVAESIVK